MNDKYVAIRALAHEIKRIEDADRHHTFIGGLGFTATPSPLLNNLLRTWREVRPVLLDEDEDE